ncbi:claspin-like [Danaus plexippus]|uniref:claspin-like n=1 Tax=Danaus plexippus TaxID=13037 RepID=UPI002AB1C5BE|nr:claspin-like [Danaus plexippus]
MTALTVLDTPSVITDSTCDDVSDTKNKNNLQKAIIFGDLKPEEGNLKDINNLSDDDVAPIVAPKKRAQHFTGFDSDEDNISKSVEMSPQTVNEKGNSQEINPKPNLDSKKPKERKSTRIKRIDSSDSDHSSSEKLIDSEDNAFVRKSVRREDKENTLKDKFKSMLLHRKTGPMTSDDVEPKNVTSANSESDDEFSCLKIKQKVKSNVQAMKSICDPDTSDEEDNSQMKSFKRRSKPKMTKSTSPKPIKMTAKQALENKQKIKSESNRMLREKGVSLPYHRPKALTLKDIMSRRKPAISSDGRTLPIKMNEDQLRQYAMLLEQRQKEVIELCKSDSEEEDKGVEQMDVTNDNKGVADECTEETTTLITELISNSNEESDVNLDNSVEVNNLDRSDKQLEPSESLHLPTESESSNKNVTDTLSDISKTDVECQESHLEENIVLQKSVSDESQKISLIYDSEKTIVEDTDSKVENEAAEVIKDNGEDRSAEFSDCEMNFDEIDKIIEEAEIICNKTNCNKPIPKLTGGPGTLIDLDNEDTASRKLSGVELLKERFSFFAKIKTLEDIEKDREKKYKPGTQHLKLKHELEEQIAEQRSLEWEKRLLEEQQLKSELNGETGEDDIEKLEAKMEEIEKEEDENDNGVSESEEELVEDDVLIEDKPKKRNPMFDDEAEVSDDESKEDLDNDDESNEDLDSEESSSESDDCKPKKGRILKAFEDSDDEKENERTISDDLNRGETGEIEVINDDAAIRESQDDELPLAQVNKLSDDVFSTQTTETESENIDGCCGVVISAHSICLSNPDLSKMIKSDINPDNMDVCGTIEDDAIMDDIAGMCSGSFSQNLVNSQTLPSTQSQEFGDDIADMCTGKFYENPLVSQDISSEVTGSEEKSQNIEKESLLLEKATNNLIDGVTDQNVSNTSGNDITKQNTVLNSILDELDDLEDKPKQNKYFATDVPSKDHRKKFVIESDDEAIENSPKKTKKLKKKKAEQRALHISDDEEEDNVESDLEEQDDRIVEYDSEENEIVVQQPKTKQSKKGITDFFENEAELTSEDEWVGSGDEDERGLDRMEREEGDNDSFHQGQLQRELGQIHMREVLDQDKREVRLIQELLFEDGDLGDGHRQRKFRWHNADGEEETGTYPEEFTDTQEDEFESEEQWRKERHEREMFIRQMREKDEEPNKSITRSTIIKANLSSRSVSSLINDNTIIKPVEKPVVEKKSAKDIPSPKRGFTIFQQNYHTSLLTRGRGALARLAALATPLADDDTPRNITNNRGNFVFTSINPDDNSKVPTKRKAEIIHTPRLIKKLKTESSNVRKPSLFDHIKI